MTDDVSRYYLTTPIYYVNDAPHIGHAYTTLIGDAGHALAPPARRGRPLPHRHRRARVEGAASGRGARRLPAEWADTTVERYRDAWRLLDIANDDFIRTTEPRHYRGVEKLLQACYDAGDIELGTYEGLYCVACEAYYTEDELIDGNCPIHGRPVEHMKEENYFFKLSRYGDRLLEWYAAHPEAVQPESRRNEVLGFIRQGLLDFSISRTSLKWGIPIPWDDRHVTYVWFDALGELHHRDRLRRRRSSGSRRGGRGRITSSARTSCASTASTGRRCCCRPGSSRRRHPRARLAARRRREDEQDEAQPDHAGRPRRRLRRRRLPLPLPAPTCRSAPTATSPTRGWSPATTPTSPTTSATCSRRVATVVGKQCGGIGPAPRPDSPLAPIAADARSTDAAEAWERVQPSERARGDLAAHPRRPTPTSRPTSPGRPSPAPTVDAVLGDALEVLRIVAVLASPGDPRRRPGDLAAHRAPGFGARPAAADARGAWGGYPGGLPVEKGDAAVPAHHRAGIVVT